MNRELQKFPFLHSVLMNYDGSSIIFEGLYYIYVYTHIYLLFLKLFLFYVLQYHHIFVHIQGMIVINFINI